jgi:hypothetical protein
MYIHTALSLRLNGDPSYVIYPHSLIQYLPITLNLHPLKCDLCLYLRLSDRVLQHIDTKTSLEFYRNFLRLINGHEILVTLSGQSLKVFGEATMKE